MEKRKPSLADIEALLVEHTERVKELMTINRTASLIAEAKPIPETLRQIALLLPRGWQYSQNACARILFEGDEYLSLRFSQTEWVQQQEFTTIDGRSGVVEVFYIQAFPTADEGPFLVEERNLICNIASLISGFLNSSIGSKTIADPVEDEEYRFRKIVYKESFKDRRELLQKFLNKQTAISTRSFSNSH